MKLAKNASVIFDVSREVYRGSLILYPKDLRVDFGNEMIDVFDDQALEAYVRHGFAGLLRVWIRAAREIVTVAFPGRLAEKVIPIIGITVTSVFMIWFASYISAVMETACSGCSVR